jgi:benzoyl-CoA 2,3-dioxygenase component B
MSNIDYSTKIPNNVNLADDRKIQRALEKWQPAFISWWNDFGPNWASNDDIFLRTAVSSNTDGWAVFDYVKMPDYRWGIFLADPQKDRKISFGDSKGQPVWDEVPGEYRADLRRLIVTQGDTEPASVEQLQHLGKTAPSLYDLRQLFQVNVEEGRHLWAMVYLLHKYFGRDGREEADMMLSRHSGDEDSPRILGAFNESTPDWLAFFMFSYFTDRDGKFQLASLAESAFDPLSRTCKFMLTEEANHMFTGESGVMRIIDRTCTLMKEHDDVTKLGGIPLDIIQRYINFHYSVSLDLFGSEESTNAASFFANGLKGRYREETIKDDHILTTNQRLHLNERLQDDYILDCERGVKRWNKTIRSHGIKYELKLPSKEINRRVGRFANDFWYGTNLPTIKDREYVSFLMNPVIEPGKFASYISPPNKGVHGNPIDYEYVRFH